MKKLFEDLLNITDVKGLMLLADDGAITFMAFPDFPERESELKNAKIPIQDLTGIREADLNFDRERMYVRKVPRGYMLVVMGQYASMATVRLRCDMLMPELKKPAPPRGLKRLFRKKK